MLKDALEERRALDSINDARLALLCSVICNRHRGKGEPTYKPADFMPVPRDRKPPTTDELREKLAALFGRNSAN